MLLDNKITSEEISEYGVESAPDRLLGSTLENKRVFDRLVRELVAKKINAILDELVSTRGAESIGAECGTVAGHIASAENPHRVTAQQIGALTAGELTDVLEQYMPTEAYMGSGEGIVAQSDFSTTAQNGVWSIRHTKSGQTHKFSGVPTASGMYLGHFWAQSDMRAGDVVVDARGNSLDIANKTAPSFEVGDLVRVVIDLAQRKVWIG